MTESIADLDKATYNAYHREYYKNKVDKTKRSAQFSAYYIKNKETICQRRKDLRLQKKQKEIEKINAVVVEQ